MKSALQKILFNNVLVPENLNCICYVVIYWFNKIKRNQYEANTHHLCFFYIVPIVYFHILHAILMIDKGRKYRENKKKAYGSIQRIINQQNCGALHDLVPFVQFKKGEKYP